MPGKAVSRKDRSRERQKARVGEIGKGSKPERQKARVGETGNGRSWKDRMGIAELFVTLQGY